MKAEGLSVDRAGAPQACALLPGMLALAGALWVGSVGPALAANPLRASFNAGTDFATGNSPRGFAVADLRGSGMHDIVVANNADNTVSVLLGNGDGTFAAKQDVAVCTAPVQVAIADMNQDGKPDLVVLCRVFAGSSVVSVLFGNGDGTFQAHVDYSLQIGNPADAGFYSADKIVLGDLNGDGFPDVVAVADFGSLQSAFGVETLLNGGASGDGTLQAPFYAMPLGTGSSVDAVLADFNGDGKLDIAYAGNNDTGSLFGPGWAFGNGDGTFSGGQLDNLNQGGCDTCIEDYAVASGDLNGDGKLDLILSTDQGPCVMLGGAGGFSTCALQAAFPNVRGQLVLADLSNRGTLDMVSAAVRINTTDWIVQVLIGTGSATFSQGPTLYDIWSAPVGGVAAVDLNGDGLPEVIGTLTDGNSIRVWLNTSVPDQAPTAGNVNCATLAGSAVDGMLAGAQSQGAILSYIVVTNPAHGTVQITNGATGAFTYTPSAGYFGTDTFTYKVNDGYLDSNVASVTVTVHSIPVATSDSVATTAGMAVSDTLKGSDPGGNPLTFTVTGQGGKGTAVITNAATGAFTYTPVAGQTGNDSFNFKVSNGFASASATESIVIGAAQSGGGGGGGGATDLISLNLLLALLARRRASGAQ